MDASRGAGDTRIRIVPRPFLQLSQNVQEERDGIIHRKSGIMRWSFIGCLTRDGSYRCICWSEGKFDMCSKTNLDAHGPFTNGLRFKCKLA